MSSPRAGNVGATRPCPHCRVVILESAATCPSCRHHLRFEARDEFAGQILETPLQVEGTVRYPDEGGSWEYTAVVVIRDAQGKEINRKVVGVGAMQPGEQRSFSLSVECLQRDGVTPRRGH